MDELEVARAIAAGSLTSPQKIDTLSLYAMRVSGTGVSYRKGLDEFVWRDPELYLSQDMIDRCAGLPVIWQHPESNTLNSEEFADRVVGGVMFAYPKDDELWCIARIYDDEAIERMEKSDLSTSPAVVFKEPSVNSKMKLKDGSTLLVEGKPSLLDHLAICERGVWDKGGDAAGIEVARKDSVMTEEDKMAAADKAKKDAEDKEKDEKEKADSAKAFADADAKLDAVLASLDSLGKRMDAYDAKADAAAKAKADEDEKEKEKEEEEKKEDKAKKDASAKSKKDWDEDEEKEEKGDPKKLAADKSKKDWDEDEKEKMDKSKAKKDAEEKEEKEKKEKMDAAARKDAEDIQRKVADLQAKVDKMPKERSDADYAAIADAQAMWAKAYSGFSKDAPRPWDGETTLGYRKRCAKDMRKHSAAWKDSDLDVVAVDANAFKNAEAAIYADSIAAANDPVNIPEDTLIERVHVDRLTGQRRIEFYGSPSAWTNQFKSGKQYVSRFGKRDNS